MNRRHLILLAFITLLAATLRFYKLGEVPVGLHRDEAFLGYNAYSILKTGQDITGARYPVHLRSFLYSPAGYAYASVPFIAAFGLSVFSIRLASALSGTFTVLVTFFLLKALFKDDKYGQKLALAGSFLLAISPWHINLSRTATENTLATLLVTGGILLFLLAQRHYVYLPAAFGLFFAALITYQAPRAFLPLFVPVLIILLRKNIPVKLTFVAVILYSVAILFPTSVFLRSPSLSLRLRTVSLLATSQTQLILDEQIREDGTKTINPWLSRAFHNKVAGYGREFWRNYLQHFSFDFLFTDKGLPDRYRIPGSGLLYLVELPLIIYGAYRLIRKKSTAAAVIFAWVILAPVGSSLAFDDVPNLQRTMLIFPAIISVSAYGLIGFLSMNDKNKFYLATLVVAFIYAYQFASYLHNYYVHQIVHRPWYRHEGYREMVQAVNALLPKYKRVIVTNRESAPAIFFLFYGKYDPVTFISETRPKNVADYDRVNFGRYEFTTTDCPLRQVVSVNDKKGIETVTYTGEADILYVNGGLCKTPSEAQLLSEIRRGDQTPAFLVLESGNIVK